MIRYEEIVLDNKGGRNRAKACEIGSPRTYILAINVKRRHMSKGQQAMAVAMVCPDPSAKTSICMNVTLRPRLSTHPVATAASPCWAARRNETLKSVVIPVLPAAAIRGSVLNTHPAT